jgi:hypothetical protein
MPDLVRPRVESRSTTVNLAPDGVRNSGAGLEPLQEARHGKSTRPPTLSVTLARCQATTARNDDSALSS